MALVAAILSLATFPSLADKEKLKGRISLTGVGEISAVPDIARVSSGVVSQAKSAAQALRDNSAAMARIITALKASNIAAKDIQTSGFSVNPTFFYDRKNRQNPPKIIGYQVRNQVRIIVRQRENLGRILDKVVKLGANQINGISFDFDKPQVLQDEARKHAVEDALRKANIYANATNTKLGRIISISEGQVRQPAPRFAEGVVAMRAKAAVPIEAGEKTLRVQVNITWKLE
jgi:uncharacterized protein YggE